jgi:hypothetical protein
VEKDTVDVARATSLVAKLNLLPFLIALLGCPYS